MNVQKFLETEIKNQAGSHAYLLIGRRKEAELALDFIVRTRNILPADVSTVDYLSAENAGKEIKVEETRQLLRDISLSPSGKNRLAVVYGADKLNTFSGNVLLKSLEEPAGPVIFVLIADSLAVLSTIKSRCRIINLNSPALMETSPTEEFLPEIKKGFPEASALIEKIVKEDVASAKNGADVPDSGGMRRKTEEIIEELVRNQRSKLLSEKKIVYSKNLEEIEKARKKIRKNGNQRLVLECLVLKIGKNL